MVDLPSWSLSDISVVICQPIQWSDSLCSLFPKGQRVVVSKLAGNTEASSACWGKDNGPLAFLQPLLCYSQTEEKRETIEIRKSENKGPREHFTEQEIKQKP